MGGSSNRTGSCFVAGILVRLSAFIGLDLPLLMGDCPVEPFYRTRPSSVDGLLSG